MGTVFAVFVVVVYATTQKRSRFLELFAQLNAILNS
jgi:hypothetical protein